MRIAIEVGAALLAGLVLVGAWFAQVRTWVIEHGTRPALVALVVVFAALAVGALPWRGRRHWPASVRAWCAFATVQTALWAWFVNRNVRWSGWLLAHEQDVRFWLILAVLATALWVGWTFTGRYLVGTEDEPSWDGRERRSGRDRRRAWRAPRLDDAEGTMSRFDGLVWTVVGVLVVIALVIWIAAHVEFR